MKSKLPQILIALAGLLLLILFAVPMWRISLIAPQYPHGVHMYIYIDHLGGKDPGTLQNINILNHYIGMKYIVPESIPELKFFPYAVVAFTFTALLVAFFNKKILYLMWTCIFGLSLVLAMYDFYLWEYDYGHSLDPNAIMKFEGESFQPPLFGTKKVITFIAQSYPMIGGYLIMLSVLLAAFATYLKYKAEKLKSVLNAVLVLLGSTLLFSCDVAPQEIAYGEDQCSSCKMMISDSRFGAELVTSKGKIFKFDAIECMAEVVLKNNTSEYAYTLVTDFEKPGQLIDASRAKFLISKMRPSPMGAFLSAYDLSSTSIAGISNDKQLIDWKSTLEYVRKGDFYQQ
jgi:copper chaperone NosL